MGVRLKGSDENKKAHSILGVRVLLDRQRLLAGSLILE
jgi:hypothetical protein